VRGVFNALNGSRALVRLVPDQAGVYANRAILRAALSQHAAALEDYNAALRLGGMPPQAMAGHADLGRRLAGLACAARLREVDPDRVFGVLVAALDDDELAPRVLPLLEGWGEQAFPVVAAIAKHLGQPLGLRRQVMERFFPADRDRRLDAARDDLVVLARSYLLRAG